MQWLEGNSVSKRKNEDDCIFLLDHKVEIQAATEQYSQNRNWNMLHFLLFWYRKLAKALVHSI